MIKHIASWLIFPLFMVTALWLTHHAIYTKGYGVNQIVFPVVFTFLVLIALMERVMPYREKWNESDEDIRTDTIHVFLTQTLIPKVLTPLWVAALTGMTVWLSNYFGQSFWPHHWHWILQLFLALTIAEFGRYWVHRWAHEVKWLWRFHAIHHSPNRLYFLNAARFHPIEKVFFLIPETIPFILLGTNAETLALYAVFNSIHGLFQHSNIQIHMGWFNYIFSMAELHRWHHSKYMEESNNNYGNNLILWDIIFGTYFLPSSREVADIGLYNPEYPKSFLAQIKAPFQGDIDKPDDFYTNIERYEH